MNYEADPDEPEKDGETVEEFLRSIGRPGDKEEDPKKLLRRIRRLRLKALEDVEKIRQSLEPSRGEHNLQVTDGDRILLYALAKKIDGVESMLVETQLLLVILLGRIEKQE